MIDFIFTRVGILIFAIEITAVLFIAGFLISDLTDKEMMSREAENIVLMLNKIQSLKENVEFVYPIGISGNLIINNKRKFKWMCNARVNTVNPEMLEFMKKAGCVRVEFGVESGDKEVLNKIKKGIKIEQIINAHAISRKAGLSIGSFVMVGNLGEDFSAVMRTKNLLSNSKAMIYILV